MKTLALYRPNALSLLERPSAMNDLSRYFDSFFEDSMLAPAARAARHLPAIDIRETEKAYLLEMELPGYDEKDITVHVDGGKLSIASKREEATDNKDEKESWILKERHIQSFSRTFKLPEDVNPEEVNAEFKNGILSMEIQKRAESRKRMIPINSK